MKRKPIPPFMILIALISLTFHSGLAANADDDQTLVFEKFVKPWIADSTFLNVNGIASIDVAVLFNEQGIVDDWVPIRTNDIKLVQSIRNVIEDWKIRPPIMQGEPSWSFVSLQVEFQHRGAVVSLTPVETLMSATGSMRDDIDIVVPFSELDTIPKPIEMESPKLSRQLLENNSGMTVEFEFFIDEEGSVRMPIVREIETEELAAAIMLDSLLKWKFEAPTKRGKPVMTRAVVPFKIP